MASFSVFLKQLFEFLHVSGVKLVDLIFRGPNNFLHRNGGANWNKIGDISDGKQNYKLREKYKPVNPI